MRTSSVGRFAALLGVLLAAGVSGLGAASKAPYPPSPVIAGVEFDFRAHRRLAPGSDNWPVTWADDDRLYTAWGDGGGFGGTNGDGRVSLGVARVEGGPRDYRGQNVWGGKAAEHPAQFPGKSYGLLSVAGVLYMWVETAEAARPRTYRLAHSTDHGATWSRSKWSFRPEDDLTTPTFLNFGRDYRGARDGYVYVYLVAPTYVRGGPSRRFALRRPGRIYLARAPKERILDRSRYEFLSGFGKGHRPTWSAKQQEKRPVFADPNGVGWSVSVSYNAGLRRVLLCTEHETTMRGKFGLFDAPEPWGPWTTVAYEDGWGRGKVEVSAFYWNFANKWVSKDGRRFTLVFTGINSNDSWNTVAGRFRLRKRD